MNDKQEDAPHSLARAALVIALFSCAVVPTAAQEASRPATPDNWRPREGIYASPGKDFNSQCGEFGDVIVELNDNSISGNEWGCKVSKLTNTAPGAIRLDMTCNDYNLAEDIKDPNPEERKFREVMLLSKIDEKSMFVQKTLNGKFKGPAWRAAYCPKDAQRMYIEAMAKSRKEAGQKIQEPSQPKTPEWRPKDGVYASSGENFNDRCLKSGDVIIELAKQFISRGEAKCKIFTLMNLKAEYLAMDVFCGTQAGPGVVTKQVNGMTTVETPGWESMTLSKVDDQSILLQKTQNDRLVGSSERLSYCPENAQHLYEASQNAGK